MSTRLPPSIAESIQEIVRPLAAATPAPRALPFLGLDHPSGTSLRLLERLAARGIFRKYEQVLDLGTRFGAVSRWVAGQLGGEAVSATGSAADAEAAMQLTRRAGVRQHVRTVAAHAARLPFADARFTHVWAVEAVAAFTAPDAMREAWRVVRPGGWLAVQAIVPAHDGASSTALRDAVAAAGFFELDVVDVTDGAIERAPQLIAAREQLDRRLVQQGGGAAEWAASGASVRTALAAGESRMVQLVARRPA